MHIKNSLNCLITQTEKNPNKSIFDLIRTIPNFKNSRPTFTTGIGIDVKMIKTLFTKFYLNLKDINICKDIISKIAFLRNKYMETVYSLFVHAYVYVNAPWIHKSNHFPESNKETQTDQRPSDRMDPP